MKSKTIGLILAASIGCTILIVGFALIEAWHTLAPAPPQLVQMHVQPPPAPARNDFFNFEIPLLPEMPVANEQPLPKENLPQVRGKTVPMKNCTITGPHAQGNLAIFLIHGQDVVQGQDILTLQEALEQNLAVVHDTRTGQLAIDNRSKAPLFIQSGDIVKGGTQDRTLPYDLLVPPLTSGAPLTAMCVEQGRSGPRGHEMTTSFQTSTEQLPGKKLKLAAYRHVQADVWNQVRLLQNNLTRNIGISVQAPQSQTSLQLTLENERMQNAIQNYLIALAPVPAGQEDVIGFAVAINGKIQSADVYASADLFQKLWPKLAKACAVEALAEHQEGNLGNPPTREQVRSFLAEAEQGQSFRRAVASRTVILRHETAQNLLFETCDPTQQNVVLHRCYLTK